MRHCNKSPTDQSEVLDNCSHITSALKVTLLQLFFFLDASFAKHRYCLLKREILNNTR